LTSIVSSNGPPPPFPVLHVNHPATTELYTLSLHDALPISGAQGDGGALHRGRRAHPPRLRRRRAHRGRRAGGNGDGGADGAGHQDRKSTRLNSSHVKISYAVFCLKKKKQPGIDNECASDPW